LYIFLLWYLRRPCMWPWVISYPLCTRQNNNKSSTQRQYKNHKAWPCYHETHTHQITGHGLAYDNKRTKQQLIRVLKPGWSTVPSFYRSKQEFILLLLLECDRCIWINRKPMIEPGWT
jgi:hypothetical protein